MPLAAFLQRKKAAAREKTSAQPLLLVLSEGGEAVLVAANPDRHQELGRFQAVEGKTWNHPVIAHGRLNVRNAQEMACYELREVEH
jgi:hypothetical protein